MEREVRRRKQFSGEGQQVKGLEVRRGWTGAGLVVLVLGGQVDKSGFF